MICRQFLSAPACLMVLAANLACRTDLGTPTTIRQSVARQRVTLDDMPMDGKLYDLAPFGEFKDPQGRLYGYVPTSQAVTNGLAIFGVVDWDRSHHMRVFMFRAMVAGAPGEKPKHYSVVTSVAPLPAIGRQLTAALEEAKNVRHQPSEAKSATSVYTLYKNNTPDLPGEVILRVEKKTTSGDMYPVSVTVNEEGKSATAVFTKLADFEKFVSQFSAFRAWLDDPKP